MSGGEVGRGKSAARRSSGTLTPRAASKSTRFRPDTTYHKHPDNAICFSAGLIESKEKHNIATIGRKNIAKLIGSGAQETNPPETTVELQGILRPDSAVDAEIIDLAVSAFQSNPERLIFVFTEDGGIQAQLSYLFAQHKMQIYSHATLKQFVETIQNPNTSGSKMSFRTLL